MLQSMELQRVGHNLAIEQQQQFKDNKNWNQITENFISLIFQFSTGEKYKWEIQAILEPYMLR